MEFITGNNFKKICNYSIDEFGHNTIREPNSDEVVKIFVKIDYVHSFFRQKNFSKPFILITHNGDLPVDESYSQYLDEELLISWYGQNICFKHPKLKSIPIGLANEIWPHGNVEVFEKVMSKNLEKNNLIYVNFDVNTNLKERTYCLSELHSKGLKMSEKLGFENYLEKLSQSYFVISPNGNGIDCHKTWEALYLKTIPIVTNSFNISFYKNSPILVLEDWKNLQIENITIDLYNKIWSNFDVNKLNINNFIND